MTVSCAKCIAQQKASRPDCSDTAYTNSELIQCASAKFKQADDSLNAIYRRILKEYSLDTAFTKRLLIAQRAWLAFRDAELNAILPENGTERYAGFRLFSMCRLLWMADLTQQRTRELMRWIDGMEEGDVCGTSIRIK
jgi:uncharacterized protein YecT (DUF1311 family)